MTTEIEPGPSGFPHGFNGAEQAEIYAAKYQLRQPPLNFHLKRLRKQLAELQRSNLDRFRSLKTNNQYINRSSLTEFVRLSYDEYDDINIKINYTSYNDQTKIQKNHTCSFFFDNEGKPVDLIFNDHHIPLDEGLTDPKFLTTVQEATDIVTGCLSMLENL